MSEYPGYRVVNESRFFDKVVLAQQLRVDERELYHLEFRGHPDAYLQSIILSMAATFVKGEVEYKEEEVLHTYTSSSHPERTIDYLLVWLTRTFPLLTAPAFKPRIKNVSHRVPYTVTKHIYNVVPAWDNSRRYEILTAPGRVPTTYNEFRGSLEW